MSRYDEVQIELSKNPESWLVTGVAGFIGSNILEKLLKLNQRVVGLDNFATGHQCNLDEVKSLVSSKQWARFHLIKGDIRNLEDCRRACNGVEHVLHQAALGSVPRSLVDPISSNETNITGFLNMLVAGRDANVKSFTYAASSSTYGDHPALPKIEENIGKPLSPYAVTKYVNELYADVFARNYDFNTVGLRYFNVYGPRQDPKGAYAAVIPKWTSALLHGEAVYINGDGETSRDFTFVSNAVQANILAAKTSSISLHDILQVDNESKVDHLHATALNQVYNIAVGKRTTLNELFYIIRDKLILLNVAPAHVKELIINAEPTYQDFRTGDVRHSQADISKAQKLLNYTPKYNMAEGIEKTILWSSLKNK